MCWWWWDVLEKAVYDFAEIGGNLLAFEEVGQLDLGGKVTATKKAQQEVFNNNQVTGCATDVSLL
ncbi:MAG: hypothetical protein K8R19_03250 [Methanosarcinales archaeon]|nr:hypothetical protein [Methanosarcinales archaeon]